MADDPTDLLSGADAPPTDPPDPASAAAQIAPEVPERNVIIKRPAMNTGHYRALVAIVRPGEAPLFAEVGWYKGNDDDHVKRQVVKDLEHGHLDGVFMDGQDARAALTRGDGVVIHAVPARSWADTKPTRYKQADPVLEIG